MIILNKKFVCSYNSAIYIRMSTSITKAILRFAGSLLGF
jgi:hypothetical protein